MNGIIEMHWIHTVRQMNICLYFVLPPELCPWWVSSLLPWEQEASNPVWLLLEGTSLKIIRSDGAPTYVLLQRVELARNTSFQRVQEFYMFITDCIYKMDIATLM